jgi:stearoyl-CoA desaturase (delta-9 desaturase)
MHVGALGILLVGFSWTALAACLLLYALRVFALTAGYHRYFSHNSYKTSRAFQFVLAWVGASSGQMGPLWWASHHRHHHQYSDTDVDIHSPRLKGFFWSHIGWLLCRKYRETDWPRVQDYSRYAELRFIDRFHSIPALALAILLYATGAWLERFAPGLGTTSWQLVVWGFFLSTVMVYHVTFAINSLTHMIGKRRFDTGDDSRNSLLLALLTFGEGWHNNHHRYPVSARQGFYWWEIDITYYILKVLSWVRIVWDLRPPAQDLYREAEQTRSAIAGA